MSERIEATLEGFLAWMEKYQGTLSFHTTKLTYGEMHELRLTAGLGDKKFSLMRILPSQETMRMRPAEVRMKELLETWRRIDIKLQLGVVELRGLAEGRPVDVQVHMPSGAVAKAIADNIKRLADRAAANASADDADEPIRVDGKDRRS